MVITKMVREHKDDCFAIANFKEGRWATPWSLLHQALRRDSLGRQHKHAWRRWWYVPCNDPSCSAALLVDEESIMVEIGAGDGY